MPRNNSSLLPLMLLPLIALLPACASTSSGYPVAPPAVPPLPVEARQPTPPEWCSPSCSSKWSAEAEIWRQRLIGVE